MLQTESDRWEEIRFYYFCLHMYHIRNNMMDLMYAIETISQIGDISVQRIKAIAGSTISEIGNTPTKDEILYLASVNKASPKDIKRVFGFTYRQMNYNVNAHIEQYYTPRNNPKDLTTIKQFMKIVDQFKGGII